MLLTTGVAVEAHPHTSYLQHFCSLVRAGTSQCTCQRPCRPSSIVYTVLSLSGVKSFLQYDSFLLSNVVVPKFI